jgi:DNA-3-methyladenine glycosylase I
VRNRLKVASAVRNARVVLKLQEEFGSFDKYLWAFVGGKPRVNAWKTHAQIPSHSAESDLLSKDLANRGCNFVGTTICYAFMQAVGMVNDHTFGCFRRDEVGKGEGKAEG